MKKVFLKVVKTSSYNQLALTWTLCFVFGCISSAVAGMSVSMIYHIGRDHVAAGLDPGFLKGSAGADPDFSQVREALSKGGFHGTL